MHKEQILRYLYDAKYELERAKIWEGLQYKYLPLHPRYYLKAKEFLEELIKEYES